MDQIKDLVKKQSLKDGVLIDRKATEQAKKCEEERMADFMANCVGKIR